MSDQGSTPTPEEQAGSSTAEGAPDAAPEGADELMAVRAERDAAQAQARLAEENFLRARAETENVRRRAQEDVTKAHKFAVESFAEALVPVADSLEKALADCVGVPDSLREGLQTTARQLKSAFERHRLVEINPQGEKFDPHRHQAISMVPGDGAVPPNHVASVLQKGWMISERVLRPALVTVVQAS